MKDRFPHIVLRQIMELDLPAVARGGEHALAEEVSRLSRDLVPQLLDRALSRIDEEGRNHQIDRLEIELELDDIADLETAFREQLPGLLFEALEQQKREAQAASNRQDGDVRTGPGDWILSLIAKGYLPWSAPQGISLEQLNFHLADLLAESPAFARALQNALRQREEALLRFLRHFGWQSARRLLIALNPSFEKHWPQRMQDAHLVFRLEPSSDQQLYWSLLVKQPDWSPEELLKAASRTRQVAPAQEVDGQEEKEEQNAGSSGPIYLQNAGLVLTHPFLARLLESVGLAKDKELTNPDEAVQLLHVLATGAPAEAEWDLILPKVLLGVGLSKSLTIREIEIGWKKEAEKMLSALISHWSILGNTTIESLRETFLQRPGRLHDGGDHWQLKVEQQPFDLLLDQLPWSIQIIRLPWMDRPLYVEWK